MKIDYLDFTAQAQNQVGDPVRRARVIATAIAAAVTIAQHLPSSEVDNAEAYFTNQVMPSVMKVVSDFNEAVIFDTRACLEQVRQLWHLRYASAFSTTMSVLNSNRGGFFGSFTGVDRFISDEFYQFANENSAAICSLSQFASVAMSRVNAAAV